MGTTSQKLTYLNDTKTQLKDMINYGLDTGEKITNETTFRNYVKSLFDAFIKTMTYPDVLYNNLPKVTGEGTSVTLNDTVYAPMRVELSPSALEQGANPSPDNPQQIHTVSGENTITISNSDNTQNQTYPLSLGDLEYCKISDYEDSFIKTSGKNLFDKDNANIIPCSMSVSNEVYILNQSSNAKSLYIPCKPNKTYTISKVLSKRFWVGTSNEIPSGNTTLVNGIYNNNGTSLTITSQNTSNYLVVYYFLNGTDTLTEQAILDSIMINEGSTALPYEPYGSGEWYLKKNIGKVVLNGSETGWDMGTGTNVFTNTNIFNNTYLVQNAYSNYFKNIVNENITGTGTANNNLQNNEFSFRWGTKDRIYIKTDIVSTIADFKTWLSTHNTTVYYVLATPTYTLLSETLQTQLDNIQKAISYQDQTNVSQTNNDLPFVLSLSAIRDYEEI